MWSWIVENRTWVFSGIGVSTILILIGFLRRSTTGIRQKQRGGDHSVNVQSAGPIDLHQNNPGK